MYSIVQYVRAKPELQKQYCRRPVVQTASLTLKFEFMFTPEDNDTTYYCKGW